MKKVISIRFLQFASFTVTLVLWVLLLGSSTPVRAGVLMREHAVAFLASDSGSNVAFAQEKIPGFRVQVYQGSSRAKAKEIRDLMMQQYAKLGVYMGFRQPDFRVRVGNFRDQAEAQAYLQMLKGEYPAAFVVPDKVLLFPKSSEEGSPTLEQDGFED